MSNNLRTTDGIRFSLENMKRTLGFHFAYSSELFAPVLKLFIIAQVHDMQWVAICKIKIDVCFLHTVYVLFIVCISSSHSFYWTGLEANKQPIWLFCMHLAAYLAMLCQLSALSEIFAAKLALVRMNASMCPHMDLQSGWSGKAGTAKIAFVWPITSMHPENIDAVWMDVGLAIRSQQNLHHVILPIMLQRETFAAYRTNMWFNTQVTSTMWFQLMFSLPGCQWTGEFICNGLIWRFLLMRIAYVTFATMFTFVGLLIAVQTHVLRQFTRCSILIPANRTQMIVNLFAIDMELHVVTANGKSRKVNTSLLSL